MTGELASLRVGLACPTAPGSFVSLAGLELLSLLPPPAKCWDTGPGEHPVLCLVLTWSPGLCACRASIPPTESQVLSTVFVINQYQLYETPGFIITLHTHRMYLKHIS